jgi:gamma-glutamyltranspeptidase/glutathione hydrolase
MLFIAITALIELGALCYICTLSRRITPVESHVLQILTVSIILGGNPVCSFTRPSEHFSMARLRLAHYLPICTLTISLLGVQGCLPAHRQTADRGSIPQEWPFRADSGATPATRGAVVSDEPLASNVGVDVMRDGGNAADAAVATAFALAVTMPEAGNIGGGGFLVLRMNDGTTAALDFREKAPMAARRDMYLDDQGRPTDRSITGHLAAGVPGSVAGLWEVHRKFGRLPWARLVEPAIRLAERGFPVSQDFEGSIKIDSARLVQFPASAALFFENGHPLVIGTRWRNPDLGATLRRIADRGPAGFYEGETAELMLKEMKRGKGLITADDLKQYTAVWRTPVEALYRGYRIISMPPPSSGGITLASIAHMLEGFDLHAMGWHSPAHIHHVVEAMRRAFADRNILLGDPDFVSIPQDSLISVAYAARRRADIDPYHATPSHKVAPGIAIARHESMHTTHFSVADSSGNVVALTTTINLGFGSAVTVTGAGFLLNNEMDDFASKPGSPNVFGLVQGEANAIAPGKRILSSMSPTIVLDRSGSPLLVTGASGGPRIITAVFQVVSNVVDFDMDISAAVTAPRFHHQHLPDTILFEQSGFHPEDLETLRTMGHAAKEIHRLAIAPSIMRREKTWYGMADPRSGGAAAGY